MAFKAAERPGLGGDCLYPCLSLIFPSVIQTGATGYHPEKGVSKGSGGRKFSAQNI